MRPTQLQLDFRELKKKEEEEKRRERKRLTLVFVVMTAFLIIFFWCSYESNQSDFSKSIFLGILFHLGLIFSGLGMMLSVLAMVGSEQEKPSPKLKLKEPVQS